MRVLALDIGQKRVGIAVSDADGRIAFPLKVLPAAEVLQHAKSFQRVLEDYEPDLLLVGKPLTMSGDAGPQLARVEAAAGKIASNTGLPIEYMDERLTSSEAKRILHDQGIDERHARGKVDDIASSLFLQAYLDKMNGSDHPDVPSGDTT